MQKKKLPDRCRTQVNPETGETDIICEEGAKTKLEVPDDAPSMLFNKAPVEFDSLHCETDRKDGKFKCKGRFSAEKKPQS
jgi:hypothetical protein